MVFSANHGNRCEGAHRKGKLLLTVGLGVGGIDDTSNAAVDGAVRPSLGDAGRMNESALFDPLEYQNAGPT